MDSKASAIWRGSLKDGQGVVSAASGIFKDAPYTFKNRFEGEKGATPEELIAAAHSACFSMALSAELGKVGITPQSVETSATVTLSQQNAGFTVTDSKLETVVSAPGADKGAIEKAAAAAKEGCPISRLVKLNIALNLTVRG